MNSSGPISRALQILSPPTTFPLTEALFLRLLGLIYLSAFGSLLPQILGLIGSRGIVPIAQVLPGLHAEIGSNAFFEAPSLFWFGASDPALLACCILGCAAAILLGFGVFSRLAAIFCFVLYLSLVTVGQPFMGFQWDALLLESGFLAFFAGAPWLVWTYRFLLFRLMFESGLVKLLSHDPNWRNLHALRFHFLTQPLPTPLAYYAYRSPDWLLDFLTGLTFFIELVVPFFLFAPRLLRHIAVALLMSLQLAILLTGNYAFFNLLTLALCLWGLDDRIFAPLAKLLRAPAAKTTSTASALRAAASLACALLMAIAALQLFDVLTPNFAGVVQKPLNAVAPFEIVNSYGLFAVMTTTRPEIVLEGSDDQMTWREYSFKYKPGNLHRGLPLIAPYQPRLDWQMWFAALGTIQENSWAENLMYRLMVGEPSVTGLLNPPPFSKPPRYMRALLYEYTFTRPSERSRTGAVWQRQLQGTWYGPFSLTGQ